MQALRLVMMGTGEFAVPTLSALYATPHQVVALVTQPDRTGPGRHSDHVNLMKQTALEHGTSVLQPEKINTPESLDCLRALAADVFVVAAYGQILSRDLLAIPRLGPINVHASLLPKYRGAAPVAFAILSGETESGVSIIRVQPALDAGPVLAVAPTPIGAEETAGELEDRLALLGAELVPRVLDQLAAGTCVETPQNDAEATRAPKLTKQLGAIDWTRTMRQIDCHIRAMQPWPKAYTYLHAAGRPPQRIMVLAVRPAGAESPGGDAPRSADMPGQVMQSAARGWVVACGDGALELVQVQPEGKRPMTAADFLRGRPVGSGDRLGPE